MCPTPPKAEDSEPPQAKLLIAQYQAENEQLRQQLQDLEILLQITSEHGSAIEADLQTANRRLAQEICERQRAEAHLKRLVTAISQRNLDLEILLDTLREHGDAIHDQWHAKVQEAKQLAEVDSLTQIPNRRRFDAHILDQWQQMMQQQQPLSVILCDVDFFKQYNDTYGHLLGDKCLQQVAESLRSTLSRYGDLMARYGGEEFAAILPNTSLDGALTIARKIQFNAQGMMMPHACSPISPYLTLSLGVASLVPTLDYSPQMLIDAADRALYLAKQTGRNRIVHSAVPALPLCQPLTTLDQEPQSPTTVLKTVSQAGPKPDPKTESSAEPSAVGLPVRR